MACSNDKRFEMNQLQYDVLQVVTSPLDDLHTFMCSVLECFHENIDSYGYLFYQYDVDPLNPGKYIARDPVSIGLPSSLWGENWRNSYYNTSIFNPNSKRWLLTDQRHVFSIGDVISPQEYENSRNYQELIKPAGIYHSFAVILKDGDKPLGHLTLSRPKEAGDYSKEELARIERIARSIGNRLLDYRKLSSYSDIASLSSFFNQYAVDPSVGAVLLNDSHRVLFYNEKAEELSAEFMTSDRCKNDSDYRMQRFADQIKSYCAPRYSVFEQTDHSGRTYQCTSTPCFFPNRDGIAFTYFVQFSADKRISVPRVESVADAQSLTRRQMEIVHFIAEGMSNREIANELVISEGTVKKHVENIRELLGVSSRIGILKKLNIV